MFTLGARAGAAGWEGRGGGGYGAWGSQSTSHLTSHNISSTNLNFAENMCKPKVVGAVALFVVFAIMLLLLIIYATTGGKTEIINNVSKGGQDGPSNGEAGQDGRGGQGQGRDHPETQIK